MMKDVDALVEHFLQKNDITRSTAELVEDFYNKVTDPEIVRKNVQTVIEEDWRRGIPVMRMDKKGIYELKPNGKKVYTEPRPQDCLY